MPLNLFTSSPISGLIWILAILIALSVHEFSHALVGTLLGDDTARRSGRLTLNPFAHVDWMGLAMLILVGFGWGKPVPFNPYNLKYPKWGPTIVALAGPFSNLVSLIVAGFAFKIITITNALPPDNLLVQFLALLMILNAVLMLFNLIPLPPLDGSKVLLSLLSAPRYSEARKFLETRGPMILLGIIIADSLLGLNILSHLFGGILNAIYRLF